MLAWLQVCKAASHACTDYRGRAAAATTALCCTLMLEPLLALMIVPCLTHSICSASVGAAAELKNTGSCHQLSTASLCWKHSLSR